MKEKDENTIKKSRDMKPDAQKKEKGIFFRISDKMYVNFKKAVEKFGVSTSEVLLKSIELFLKMSDEERRAWFAAQDPRIAIIDRVLLSSLWTEHAFTNKHWGWLLEGSLALRELTKETLPQVRQYADYRAGYALLALAAKLRIEAHKNRSSDELRQAIECAELGILANQRGGDHPVFRYNTACGYALIASCLIEIHMLDRGLPIQSGEFRESDPYSARGWCEWRSSEINTKQKTHIEGLIQQALEALKLIENSTEMPPKDVSFLQMKSLEDPDLSLIRNDQISKDEFNAVITSKIRGNPIRVHVAALLGEMLVALSQVEKERLQVIRSLKG